LLVVFLANKKRTLRYTPLMATARCKVSYSDSEGFVHVAYVEAESLYEAVALAVFHFRDEAMASRPGPMTEFTVALDRPAVEHHVRLNQVTKWAAHTTREGPAGVVKRERVRALLG
jgi:hypothetical protein